jgi:hypothetical protein
VLARTEIGSVVLAFPGSWPSKAAEDQLAGDLTVNGTIVPDCIKNPPTPDPDAMGAPGCQGVDFVPLWVANFVQVE